MDVVLCLTHGHVLTLSDVTEAALRDLLMSEARGVPQAVEHEDGIAYVAPSQVVAVQTS